MRFNTFNYCLCGNMCCCLFILLITLIVLDNAICSSKGYALWMTNMCERVEYLYKNIIIYDKMVLCYVGWECSRINPFIPRPQPFHNERVYTCEPRVVHAFSRISGVNICEQRIVHNYLCKITWIPEIGFVYLHRK